MAPEPFLIGDPVIPGKRPLRAVFLNYLLDCLPAADLKIKGGEVCQLYVRTCLARNLPLSEYTNLTPQDIARKARSGNPLFLSSTPSGVRVVLDQVPQGARRPHCDLPAPASKRACKLRGWP